MFKVIEITIGQAPNFYVPPQSRGQKEVTKKEKIKSISEHAHTGFQSLNVNLQRH